MFQDVFIIFSTPLSPLSVLQVRASNCMRLSLRVLLSRVMNKKLSILTYWSIDLPCRLLGLFMETITALWLSTCQQLLQQMVLHSTPTGCQLLPMPRSNSFFVSTGPQPQQQPASMRHRQLWRPQMCSLQDRLSSRYSPLFQLWCSMLTEAYFLNRHF